MGGTSSSSKEVEPTSIPVTCPVSKTESKCPVDHSKKYKNPDVYNVYSQKIDPTNNMPALANQSPTADQSIALSTSRTASTIPKAGTDNETWVYPSPQMFWNALVRKNKVEGATEKDMDTVIAIHNNMNEKTWMQVLEWEKLRPSVGPGREPKLLRFLGRPNDLSPKARLRVLFGSPAPFDRHDWYIDRGGQIVRYVIDYYHDESSTKKDVAPKTLNDPMAMKSILVDVRPGLDSFHSVIDRVFVMPYMQLMKKTAYSAPTFFMSSIQTNAAKQKVNLLTEQLSKIRSTCKDYKIKLDSCKDEAECGAAAVALQRCTASVVCSDTESAFGKCIAAEPKNMEAVSRSYDEMIKCLELFQLDTKQTLSESPPK